MSRFKFNPLTAQLEIAESFPSNIQGHVDFFADLPTGANVGDQYIVDQDSGSLLTFNKREAGLYRWNGTAWIASADITTLSIEADDTNIGSGSTQLQAVLEYIDSLVDTNTTDITTNQTNITQNTTDIANNTTDIVDNEQRISDNETDILNNSTDIADNTADITTNISDITTNTTNISTNNNNIVDLQNDLATLEIDDLADSPIPSPATAGCLYQLRENDTGTGLEWWRDFYQVNERTDGIINQQNAVFEPYLSVTYDIKDAGDYLFDFSYIFSMNNTTLNFEAHLEINGTDVYPLHIEPKDAGGAGLVLPIIAGGVEGPATVNSGTDQFLNNAGKMIVNLPAGANTILLEFSARGAANLEAAIHRALFVLKRIP